MLLAEVQSVTRLCYKYWTEKYSNYVETCDAVDMMEAKLAMHAHSQGFFVNAQMDMRRLQKVNREFERRASKAVADAQKLKDEVDAAEEALEASKLKHAELESAQVKGLASEAAGLEHQLEGVGAVAVEEYIAHFHETSEYDGLGMYWRGVAYNEVFKRLTELHPELDFVRNEFIPVEPSTPADEEVADGGDVD
ncbi:S-norcoclaurine synthase [Olea europaea subsp. europaea]|uniref:S-norcoclaurine synthase n=1 Tax=Olea europaea subsp. europaea TaxID=158383 RepID=A0A8S0U8D2_OLEEU|nr:S-norcoclaurine synthase [Olea europaea subsp. europaea]